MSKKAKSAGVSALIAVVAFVVWFFFDVDLLEDPASPPPSPPATRAEEQLAQLRVAPAGSMEGYSRERFEHWVAQPDAGKNCNTREAVLRRDGENVQVNNACEAVSGTWVSAYTGERLTDPSDVDIDHLVPLANAWRSGANTGDDQRREQFANDLESPQLLAVDSSSNRSKGDQDPSQWKPMREAWCDYAKDWIAVKHTYQLSVTAEEKSALQEMLATCG